MMIKDFKEEYFLITAILLTFVFLLSSCAYKDNTPKTSKQNYISKIIHNYDKAVPLVIGYILASLDFISSSTGYMVVGISDNLSTASTFY